MDEDIADKLEEAKPFKEKADGDMAYDWVTRNFLNCSTRSAT